MMESDVTLLGGVIMDRYLRLDGALRRGMDACIDEAWTCAGGCSLNIAVTLQNFGVTGHIVSYLGSDGVGDEIERYLRARSLSLRAIGRAGEPSGYCLTLLDPEGERTFLTRKGAEQLCDDALLLLAPETRFLFVTGYYLVGQTSSSALMAYIRRRKAAGCTLFFDPGPLADRLDAGVLREMLHLADVVLPNSGEARYLADDTGVDEWALAMARQSRVVINTRGARGGACYSAQGRFDFAAIPAPVADSSGAGDAFAGGVIAGYVRGLPLRAAVDWGRAAAALAVRTASPHVEFELGDVESCLSNSK